MLSSRLGNRANVGRADDIFQLTFMIIRALLPWKKSISMLSWKHLGRRLMVLSNSRESNIHPFHRYSWKGNYVPHSLFYTTWLFILHFVYLLHNSEGTDRVAFPVWWRQKVVGILNREQERGSWSTASTCRAQLWQLKKVPGRRRMTGTTCYFSCGQKVATYFFPECYNLQIFGWILLDDGIKSGYKSGILGEA